jgi:hypothetical protein
MPKAVRKPPGVSELKTFRAREYFDQDVYNALSLIGEATVDLPAMSTGNTELVAVTVPGARPDIGQTVHVGVPSNWPLGFAAFGYVSSNDTVIVLVYNYWTAAPVNPGPMNISVRVMP